MDLRSMQSTRTEVLQDPSSWNESLEVVDGNLSVAKRASRVDGSLHEDPYHSWSQNTKALRNLESLSRVRVKKTKQFGTFMTHCHPIVEELESSSTNPGTSPILCVTSVLRCRRRTLEEVT